MLNDFQTWQASLWMPAEDQVGLGCDGMGWQSIAGQLSIPTYGQGGCRDARRRRRRRRRRAEPLSAPKLPAPSLRLALSAEPQSWSELDRDSRSVSSDNFHQDLAKTYAYPVTKKAEMLQ